MDLEKEVGDIVISDAMMSKASEAVAEHEPELEPQLEPQPELEPDEQRTRDELSMDEQHLMIKRKEAIMMLSLKRRAEQEAKRAQKEAELARKREEEAMKKEMQEHRKLEHKLRREAILEQYRLKKKAAQLAANHQGNHCYPSSNVPSITTTATTSTTTTTTSTTISENKSSTDHRHHHHNNNHHHHHHPHQSTNGANNNIQANHIGAVNHCASAAASQRSASNLRGCKSQSSTSSSSSSWNLYTGPKLFAKPTIKTNLILIQNALLKALEGAANAKLLKKMQDTIAAHSKTCAHFLILFRSRNQFRGLYEYHEKQDSITKLDGAGPRSISNDDIVKYYKYDSPKRLFTEVQTRQISLTIIAITIQDHLWSKT